MNPPATVGQPLAQVDTPALILDLDAFERNLKTVADLARTPRPANAPKSPSARWRSAR